MSNDYQDSLECKICYDYFDESLHRPLTLVCENETCGHTFCSACIKELTRRVCPACNAQFRHTTTNWFVIGLIRNPNGNSINTAFVNKLKDEVDNIKINTKELNRILSKVLCENNLYYQDVKQKIENKVQEAHLQLKIVQDNLLEEFCFLKNSYEKTLNENRLFETEMQEHIKLWNKQLNSGEYKANSEKLNRVYIDIETYMNNIEDKKKTIANYTRLQEVCYFEEKFFKFDKKFLGEIKKSLENHNVKLLRFKFIIGTKMFLNGFWHLITGLCYFLIGFWYIFSGILLLLIGCFKKTKINFNFNEELFKIRVKTICSILFNNSIKNESTNQQLQIQYNVTDHNTFDCTERLSETEIEIYSNHEE